MTCIRGTGGVPFCSEKGDLGGYTVEYKVKTICRRDEIDRCERFEMDHYQWHCVVEPKTYGYMGYLKGEGFYVQIRTEETDPLRRCKNHHDMVCKDSAVEVFLAFTEQGREISNDDMYLNFEVNANGAMYAKYGFGRKGRQFLPDTVYAATEVKSEIDETGWTMSLLIPEDFLKSVCGFSADGDGKDMYCNFYKISEDPDIEHYGSFSPIESETPNFHLPVCFAKAIMV